MPVAINFKICDNSQDCSGLDVCPTGVFEWNKDKQTLTAHNEKCIVCGKCKDCCPVGAIYFAKNKEEYEKIVKEIEEDPRQVADLFVDRYGASPIVPSQQVDEKNFVTRILESQKIGVLEAYDDNSIQCLLKSIPMKELLHGFDVKYRKMKVDLKFTKKYGIKELPALVFFRKGKLVGKIEGYYPVGKKLELVQKIKIILGGE